MDDNLIRADDVLEHYNKLKAYNQWLARITVFEGFGHNHFTYASHESINNELIKTLKSYMQEQRIYSINQMMAAFISMTLTETS